MGNPSDFYKNVIEIERGRMLDRNVFLRRLVDSLYVRNDIELNRGNFRVKGDTVDIYSLIRHLASRHFLGGWKLTA